MRDGPHHGPDGTSLLEEIDAEPADTEDRVCCVELVFSLEALPEVLGQDPVHHLADLLVVHAQEALDRAQRAVDADRRGQLVGEVEVRGAVAHRVGEQLVDVQTAVRIQRRLERLHIGRGG